MYVVRPVAMTDLGQLEALAKRDSQRVHTLPRQRAALGAMIEHSVDSFARAAHVPGDERYTFVLDLGDGTLGGIATLVARAGAGDAFLAFRHDRMRMRSEELNVSADVDTLSVCTDLSSHSQLAGFHAPDPALDRAQKALLARARLMYAMSVPQAFADNFFASMPGRHDASGGSPFWDAIGRKFFGLGFLEAEALLQGARDGSRMIPVIPHHPVYVQLLPAQARAAIATADAAAAQSLGLLYREGFESGGYIDLCDGGPVLHATRRALRSASGAQRRRVSAFEAKLQRGVRRYLVCNVHPQRFRSITAWSGPLDEDDHLSLTPQQRRLLDVTPGDPISCVLM